MLENYDPSKLLDENGKFLTIDQTSDYSQPQYENLMEKQKQNISDLLNKYYETKRIQGLNNVEAKAKYLMERVMLPEDKGGLGLTREQAAGIAGNIYVESKFNPKAVGDGGKAHGIAQWHPSRRKGVDMLNMPFEDQVTYLIEELKDSEKKALKQLKLTTNPIWAAEVIDQLYERSSGKHRKHRQDMAFKFNNLM